MNEKTSSDRTCPKCGAALAADTLEGLCPACLLALNLATQTQMPDEIGPNGTKKIPPPPKSPPTPEEITSRFPQFEILECLGRGGMGVVYKARQKSLERLVALKIIAPEREKDPQFAERFAREAKTLAQLSHPSIVTVHDFGEANGMFYLVMEYVDGVNLRQLLKERKLSPEEALAIVPPVCEALQYAHQQGVIHRDIKPENLLLDKQGRIKIADFGIAKILGRAAEKSGQRQSAALQGVEGTAPSVPTSDRLALTRDQVIGTPQYMAPEQTSDPTRVDHRADIFSLGVVLYEMLTGELPASKLQPPSRKVQVDVRIDEIVLRALEKEPEQRYQTAEQFKTVVETISTSAAKTDGGRQKSEGGQRQRTSAAARQKYNPWETTIIGVGTMFFFVMSFVVWDYSGPFRVPLIVMWALGLGICILSIAGLWPFPSPFFPEPNFSSRNLRRSKGSATPPRAAVAPASGGLVRGCFFVAGTAVLVWFGLLLLLAIGGIIVSLVLPALHRAKSQATAKYADATNAVASGMAASSFVISGPSDHPVAQVMSGESAEVQLGRGISAEIVGVLRNPRESDVWLKPDGSVFETAPVEVVQLAEPRTIDSPGQSVEPEDEVLVYYRVHTPEGVSMESIRMKWRPQPLLLQTAEEFPTVRDAGKLSQMVAHFALREAASSLNLTVELLTSDALWEPVAEFDGARTKELLPNAMVVFSPPRFDERAKRYVIDVMHNLSREHHGLRLVAHLKGGRREEIDFHTGVLSGTPTKGFALVYPDEVEVDEVEKWVLERTPWLRGEIRNIALQPRAAPADDATAYTATFSPVIERVLSQNSQSDVCFIDLDDNRVFAPPSSDLSMEELNQWITSKGIDAIAMTREAGAVQGLVGWDMRLLQVDGSGWQDSLPKALAAKLESVQPLREVIMRGENALPATFLLQTREGGKGVLQITGFTDNPRGVKIRYKLVKWSKGSPPVTTSSKRQRFVPEPGMADQTSWAVFDKPSFLNSNGWAVMSRMTIGGVAKIKLPGETERRCNIELLKGDDTSLTIRIYDLARNSVMTLSLLRDQMGEITVDGAGYRVTYLSVYVANDKPDTSAFAQVVVTPVN